MRKRWEATVPSPAASRGDQGGEAQTDAKVNLRAWTVDCSHKPIAYQTPVESSCSSAGRSDIKMKGLLGGVSRAAADQKRASRCSQEVQELPKRASIKSC